MCFLATFISALCIPNQIPTIVSVLTPCDVYLQVNPANTTFTGNDVCPVGYYCPNGTSYPVPCPVGTYSVNPGLGDVAECVPCPQGRWCNETAYTNGNNAALCAPG